MVGNVGVNAEVEYVLYLVQWEKFPCNTLTSMHRHQRSEGAAENDKEPRARRSGNGAYLDRHAEHDAPDAHVGVGTAFILNTFVEGSENLRGDDHAGEYMDILS